MPKRSERRAHPLRIAAIYVCMLGALVLAADPAGASGTTWSVGLTPATLTIPESGQTLSSVSCASTHVCVAVGNEGSNELVDVYNGTKWTRSTWGAPYGYFAMAPQSVSCASTKKCVVVGTLVPISGSQATGASFVQTWNGATWTTAVISTPVGWSSVNLYSVSCIANTCRAVGDAVVTSASTSSIIQAVSTGAGWTVSVLGGINATFEGSLDSISCVSPTWCAAVGSNQLAGSLLSETFNGTTWSGAVSTIATGSFFNTANPNYSPTPSVSCAAIGSCVATANVLNATAPLHSMVVDTLSDGVWSLTEPSGVTSAGSDVACPTSPTLTCRSVGAIASANSLGYSSTVASDVSGTWTNNTFPSSQTNNALNAVSCVTASWCAAVGSEGKSPVVAIRTTSWAVTVQSSGAATPLFVPYAAACQSASSCKLAAVEPTGVGPQPVIVTHSTKGWSGVLLVAELDYVNYGLLSSESCHGAACVAVGAHQGEFGASDEPLIAVGSGSSWALRLLYPTNPGPNGAALTGVSCSSASSCVAVGWIHPGPSSASIPFYANYNAGTWTQGTLPDPSGVSSAALTSISCPTASFCLAVGWANNGHTEGYQAVWSAGHWTGSVVPRPSGISSLAFVGVSCVSASYCAATITDIATAHPLVTAAAVKVWTGTWSGSTAVYSARTSAKYVSIDCPTTTSCVAVGYAGNSILSTAALVAVQSPTGWTTSPLPTPSGDSSFALDSVSCWSADQCVSVGPAALDTGGVTIVTETHK